MKKILRVFFRLLYHQFAFTYDLVAASVSFNRWKDWVMSVVPFIEGDRVLEMGHGPGHLQRILLTLPRSSGQDRNPVTVGIDESAQMGRLAKRNLTRFSSSERNSPAILGHQHIAYTQINLTRAVAQHLPFPNKSFDTIVATFPTEYITDPVTLGEVKRCLSKGGRLIVLPAVLPRNPFSDWLFKVTHQSPTEGLEVVKAKFKEPFVAAGFEAEVNVLDVKSGTLLLVLAMNSGAE
jgi:ubiquinone/menaquinone biosynthesis C-methylase UbiE